ncbi:MAG: hypothetical protein JOZ15_16535, partial [Acidobacteria bacterium]|nr:hypothetical protein [Acidobacteriota bacterium]
SKAKPNRFAVRNLGLSKADYGASILKAGLAYIPLAGPVLTELINDFIPGQRTDRLVAFVRELDARLTDLTKEIFAANAQTPAGADLMEDGLWMAARAFTDERRKAIANLLITSLTAEQLRYAESKKLLQLLNELQDPEIVMLRYFYLLDAEADRANEFYKLHESILEPDTSAIGSGEQEINRGGLYKAHKSTFQRLGLTQPRSTVGLNWLGRMLVHYIGID